MRTTAQTRRQTPGGSGPTRRPAASPARRPAQRTAKQPARAQVRTSNRPAASSSRAPQSRARSQRASINRTSRRRPSRQNQRSRRSPLPLVLLLVAVLALGFWGFISLRSCESKPEVQASPYGLEVADLYNSPYNWSHLTTDKKGRFSYKKGGKTLSRVGIDVSSNQGIIDWSDVASDGIEFAMIRVGYRGTRTGKIIMDDCFTSNFADAKEEGLDVGVYFFSQAKTVKEAQEEADFVISQLNSAKLDYPVSFDFEPGTVPNDRISDLSGEQSTKIALAFCERIEEAGYTPIIYGNRSDLGRFDLDQLAKYGFWFASYESKPSSDLAFAMWQYSESGTVKGISTNVDLNIDLTPVLSPAQS